MIAGLIYHMDIMAVWLLWPQLRSGRNRNPLFARAHMLDVRYDNYVIHLCSNTTQIVDHGRHYLLDGPGADSISGGSLLKVKSIVCEHFV